MIEQGFWLCCAVLCCTVAASFRLLRLRHGLSSDQNGSPCGHLSVTGLDERLMCLASLGIGTIGWAWCYPGRYLILWLENSGTSSHNEKRQGPESLDWHTTPTQLADITETRRDGAFFLGFHPPSSSSKFGMMSPQQM